MPGPELVSERLRLREAAGLVWREKPGKVEGSVPILLLHFVFNSCSLSPFCQTLSQAGAQQDAKMSSTWPLSSRSSWSSWRDSQPKPKVRCRESMREGEQKASSQSHRSFTKAIVLKDEAWAAMDQKDQRVWGF